MKVTSTEAVAGKPLKITVSELPEYWRRLPQRVRFGGRHGRVVGMTRNADPLEFEVPAEVVTAGEHQVCVSLDVAGVVTVAAATGPVETDPS